MLDDVERAVDDGVNSYKLLGRDARAVAGGGAVEIEIARQLAALGRTVRGGDRAAWCLPLKGRVGGAGAPGLPRCTPLACRAPTPCPTCFHCPQETGLDQYALVKYAEALEVVPRTIAENSGLPATDAVAALHAAHAGGQAAAGLDVETGACARACMRARIGAVLERRSSHLWASPAAQHWLPCRRPPDGALARPPLGLLPLPLPTLQARRATLAAILECTICTGEGGMEKEATCRERLQRRRSAGVCTAGTERRRRGGREAPVCRCRRRPPCPLTPWRWPCPSVPASLPQHQVVGAQAGH